MPIKKQTTKTFLFDLHLDLEVYLNKNLRKILGMNFYKLDRLYVERHFDLVQARKVGLKYFVTQVQAVKYNSKEKIIFSLNDFDEFIANYENFLKQIKKYPQLKIIKSLTDFNSLSEDQIGVFLGVEGLNFINKIDEVELLIDLGFRVFGLTWNFDNKIAGGLNSHKPLTKFGKKVVELLVARGCIIDCAHLNHISALEVIDLAPSNFIFSHNNLNSVVAFKQNLSSEILSKIKTKETLIGLTFLPSSLTTSGQQPTFKHWFQHYKELKKINPQFLAIGTDYFGFAFKDTALGAKNYIEFNNSLMKFKISKAKIFFNTFNYFYNKIKIWQ
ncbi:MAG: diguanylate cyclase [Candidatus Parcubacteria bacterium]|nr:MAG: diguanylate cyclase [Candidatus Parcubacteria bacterium]